MNIHWVEYYKQVGGEWELPNTELAAKTTLCLPLHQSLSDNDIEKIVEKVKKYE